MVRPTKKTRVAALGLVASPPALHLLEDADFPGLVGPGIDDMPQDFQEFYDFEERSPVLPTRNKIYVVPVGLEAAALLPHHAGVPLPTPKEIAAYLTAFTSLAHVILPPLEIAAWDEDGKGTKGKGKGKKGPSYLAVKTATDSLVRVRTRKPSDNEFSVSLHCWDVLDGLAESLPDDAFCILGLTTFDIHEDDSVVCGRAFGGSRIAIVSLARYHPNFVEEHEWPALKSSSRSGKGGPLLAAARAAIAQLPPYPTTPLQLTALWAQRTAVTAMHELGHCLGMDHCLHFDCFMGENDGQAPYACPVCLKKLLCAVHPEDDTLGNDPVFALQHYRRVESYCAGRPGVLLWEALRVWAHGRAERCGGGGDGVEGAGAEGDPYVL